MTTHRQVDEPSPTIVGPRPAEGAGGKLAIPQGMERLLTLAGISAEWREKVLADPLSAAAEAEIELSESERAILKAVPRAALEGMAGSFARKHGFAAIAKSVAGAAAAAALVVTTACGGAPPACGGIRADDPPPPPPNEGTPAPAGIRPDVPEEAPAVLWMNSLDAALAQAKKDNRAVMAVFLHPKPRVNYHNPDGTRGIRPDPANPTLEEKSQRAVLSDSKEFRAAVGNADLVSVRLSKPPVMPRPRPLGPDQAAHSAQAFAAYEKEVAAYEAALKKYGLEEEKLPAVVWLAPDGSELARLVQPDEESILVKTIGEVPPKLAAWITAQRRLQTKPGAAGGIRSDMPAPAGSRPAPPPEKE